MKASFKFSLLVVAAFLAMTFGIDRARLHEWIKLNFRVDQIVAGEWNRSKISANILTQGLLAGKLSEPHRVIVIEGSSASARGIDASVVQATLSRYGFDVSVIQLTGIGAGHFERSKLLRQFFHRLESLDKKEADVELFLLREIHPIWDKTFSANIEKNLGTTVLKGYVDLAYASRIIWEDIKQKKKETQPSSLNRLSFYISLLFEGLKNQFHVGWYQYLSGQPQFGIRGFQPLGSLKTTALTITNQFRRSGSEWFRSCHYATKVQNRIDQLYTQIDEDLCRNGCWSSSIESSAEGQEINEDDISTVRVQFTQIPRVFSQKGDFDKHQRTLCDSLTGSQDSATMTVFVHELTDRASDLASSQSHSVIKEMIQKTKRDIGSEPTPDTDLSNQVLFKNGIRLRRDLLSGLLPETVETSYFGFPSLLKRYRQYVSSACNLKHCVLGEQELAEFLSSTLPDEWVDDSHLTHLGAVRFSESLAQQIINRGLLSP